MKITEPALDDPLAQAVERRFADQVAFLAALVRSPSDNPPGDTAGHAALTARLLAERGLEAERHVVPEDALAPQGLKSATNLIVRQVFGGSGPVVALNAHGDVVPPGADWTTDPYGAEIRDGRMFGRGVAVSKSDIATYAFALLALRDVAPAMAGTIELHVTYDEETGGSAGPAWLLERGLSRPDYAICAGFGHSVVTAHNGCLHLEVIVEGRSAHAALPETGHDALEGATAVLNALYAHRLTLAQRMSATPGITAPTLVVGRIEGGINTNVVPDRVALRLDRRIVPEESAGAVEAELVQLILAAVADLPGISVRVKHILLAQPLEPVGDSATLAALLAQHAADVMDHAVHQVGVPLYTDARHYAAAGVATVLYGAGPLDMASANAHRADENLALSDLKGATLVVARTLRDLLTPDEPPADTASSEGEPTSP
ncbi:M20/M25/M40 family metallo-hydrolase [Zavarzinia sp. CC-PAN008]|uniref:M20/M25/M40 family metallo-hydrolase n=1 Tax=Zavarzinia sp. CC-PAN008 TaxID=3243332 RepID=UPI003F746FB2